MFVCPTELGDGDESKSGNPKHDLEGYPLFGGLTPISSCQSGKMGHFESFALPGLQNNLPSRDPESKIRLR